MKAKTSLGGKEVDDFMKAFNGTTTPLFETGVSCHQTAFHVKPRLTAHLTPATARFFHCLGRWTRVSICEVSREKKQKKTEAVHLKSSTRIKNWLKSGDVDVDVMWCVPAHRPERSVFLTFPTHGFHRPLNLSESMLLHVLFIFLLGLICSLQVWFHPHLLRGKKVSWFYRPCSHEL